MAKVITVDLSTKSIDRAIREIREYRSQFISKTELFRNKVAERIAQEAQSGFSSSIVDDLLQEESRTASVDVTCESQEGGITLVIAKGEDAIWVEFGTGVFHNGSVGSSPHPKGADLGFLIGTYGKGKGSRKVWGYRDEKDELHLTHGTPATMPMYNAMKKVSDEIYEIAQEVFR